MALHFMALHFSVAGFDRCRHALQPFMAARRLDGMPLLKKESLCWLTGHDTSSMSFPLMLRW